jgi:hypothetical protein
MFGINGGYDSRPMNTGGSDTGIIVSGTEESAFFQQVAVNAEAVSNDWNFNAYALIPIGDTEQPLNWFYQGGALNTYGLDVGYFITPEWNASVGYYYQHGDLGSADGSGVLGRLAYEISNGLTAGVNLSYDEAFETRVSADLKVRFGGPSTTAQRKEVQQQPVINALTATPRNRDVRVHDCSHPTGFFGLFCTEKDIDKELRTYVAECGNDSRCSYFMDLMEKQNIAGGPVIRYGEKGKKMIKSCRADFACAYKFNRIADIYGYGHIYQWAI